MDRQELTVISLWIHVPFIVAWIGFVMVDAIALFAPGFQKEQRVKLLLWSRPFVILGIVVIMITGVWQTIENPFYRIESWSGLSELRARTLYGDLLFWKHAFVVATFVLTILTRFVLAPRLRDEPGGVVSGGAMALTAESSTMRLTKLSALANLAACLGSLLMASRMVMELH